MFGGLVETVGTIENTVMANDCQIIFILPQQSWDDIQIGDSIAVNGVCLTLTHMNGNILQVAAVPETLRLTNLAQLTKGDTVNLERSLPVGGRIGGHYVQGHVDGVGEIIEMQPEGDALLVKISIPAALAKYIVSKGYIALDGMSITVMAAMPTWFTVTFIPHTQQVTRIRDYHIGTVLNIEVDILGKYIEKLLGGRSYD